VIVAIIVVIMCVGAHERNLTVIGIIGFSQELRLFVVVIDVMLYCLLIRVKVLGVVEEIAIYFEFASF
jgi:hypothetical protein